MYIQITVDLRNYSGSTFDLRLSNYHSIQKVVEIAWQAKGLEKEPRPGYWVRVENKQLVCPGYLTLAESGITTGDRLEIL
ncbi:MAG TPA: EsaB/YukD family protein [Chondromyces sp.]|nr:EsaB/YukD family protein [Chondromyces sp.]